MTPTNTLKIETLNQLYFGLIIKFWLIIYMFLQMKGFSNKNLKVSGQNNSEKTILKFTIILVAGNHALDISDRLME